MSRCGLLGLTFVLIAVSAAGQRPPDCQSNGKFVISQDASLTACTEPQAELLIADTHSQKTWSIPTAECASPTTIERVDAQRIGVICSVDPSLNNYLVLDAASGRVQARYAGIWFFWSPDKQTLAHVGVVQKYGTPEGNDYCLLMNGRSAYPTNCTFEGRLSPTAPGRHRSANSNSGFFHSFFPEFAWSPDSQRLAFLEKTFEWEYIDPFNAYWDGTVSKLRYYLVIVPVNGGAYAYSLHEIAPTVKLAWTSDTELTLDRETFNLRTNAPQPIR
jgi:hypothetical protein